jgi:hypothetical protein
MALTPCTPCGCIPGNIGNDKFKQDVEVLLCAILTAVGGPDEGLIAARFFFGSVAAAGINTSTFTTLVTNTGNERAVAIDVFNRTDRDMYISFNGTDNQEFVPTGVGKLIQFRDNLRYVDQNVSIKAVGSNATTGSVYGTIIY